MDLDVEAVKAKIAELKAEHRVLDDEIARVESSGLRVPRMPHGATTAPREKRNPRESEAIPRDLFFPFGNDRVEMVVLEIDRDIGDGLFHDRVEPVGPSP